MVKTKRCCKWFVIFTVLSLLFSSVGIVSVAADADMPSETIEKVYCSATLEDSFEDNGIIIVVMPEYNNTVYTISDFSAINCTEIKELSIDVKEGTLGRIIKLTIAGNSKQNVLDAIDVLEQRNDIYSAEPNYLMEADSTVPNDIEYSNGNQWAIDKIQLPQAWDISTGSSTVRVGIVDSGIDNTHPDLVNRVNIPLSRIFLEEDSTPFDDHNGHGTFMAGIVGAQGNNSIGVVGTCWNVQLVSLKTQGISGGHPRND